MRKDEKWIKEAMANDTIVADLLMRLKQHCLAMPSTNLSAVLPPLNWRVRQPRSKSVLKCVDILSVSPTTPLSWSGGTVCLSPTADRILGDTSYLTDRQIHGGRYASTATTSKKSRRKKTFAELKDEESVLLEERIYLEKRIAELHVTVKEHRGANEKLKKLKVGIEKHEKEIENGSRKGNEEDEFLLPDLNMTPAM